MGKFNVRAEIKSRKLPRFLYEDEVFRMFKIAKRNNKRDYTILKMLYYLGLRSNELRTLKSNDINIRQKVIRVIGKGNKEAYIPIPQVLLKELEVWVSKCNKKTFLFGRDSTGLISNRQLRRIVKKYAKKARIKNWEEIHPHSLRHSYGTHLWRKKVPIEVIKKLMRHAALQTTLIYTHMDVEDTREFLDGAFNNQEENKQVQKKK